MKRRPLLMLSAVALIVSILQFVFVWIRQTSWEAFGEGWVAGVMGMLCLVSFKQAIFKPKTI